MKTTTRKSAKSTKAPKSVEYIDTEGLELSDDSADNSLTPTQKARKDKKEIKTLKASLKSAKQPKANPLFQGTIAATKVLRKRLDAFKNCVAFAWCILNVQQNTVTYANSYGQSEDGTMPRSSFKPEQYTFIIKEKVIAKKLDEYVEIEDPSEWPTWITPAAPAPKAKPAKKEPKIRVRLSK